MQDASFFIGYLNSNILVKLEYEKQRASQWRISLLLIIGVAETCQKDRIFVASGSLSCLLNNLKEHARLLLHPPFLNPKVLLSYSCIVECV